MSSLQQSEHEDPQFWAMIAQWDALIATVSPSGQGALPTTTTPGNDFETRRGQQPGDVADPNLSAANDAPVDQYESFNGNSTLENGQFQQSAQVPTLRGIMSPQGHQGLSHSLADDFLRENGQGQPTAPDFGLADPNWPTTADALPGQSDGSDFVFPPESGQDQQPGEFVGSGLPGFAPTQMEDPQSPSIIGGFDEWLAAGGFHRAMETIPEQQQGMVSAPQPLDNHGAPWDRLNGTNPVTGGETGQTSQGNYLADPQATPTFGAPGNQFYGTNPGFGGEMGQVDEGDNLAYPQAVPNCVAPGDGSNGTIPDFGDETEQVDQAEPLEGLQGGGAPATAGSPTRGANGQNRRGRQRANRRTPAAAEKLGHAQQELAQVKSLMSGLKRSKAALTQRRPTMSAQDYAREYKRYKEEMETCRAEYKLVHQRWVRAGGKESRGAE